MKWIRLWVNETFQSTTFQELTTSERGVWYSLLIMAGMNLRHPGIVELRDGTPYPDYIIPTILNCSMDEWTTAKARLLSVVKLDQLPDGRLKIANWSKYQTEYEKYRKKPPAQSEYERQKKYRRADQKIGGIVKISQNPGHPNPGLAWKHVVGKTRCKKCGSSRDLEVHHLNTDPADNQPDNLVVVCREHHMDIHTVLNRLKKKGVFEFNYSWFWESKTIDGLLFKVDRVTDRVTGVTSRVTSVTFHDKQEGNKVTSVTIHDRLDGDVEDTDTDTDKDKDIFMSKKTPFREKLLPLFLLEWSRTHEGSYTVSWERDGMTAKKLWNQCRKDDPINPLKCFKDRMRLVMSGRIIDNFSALLSFWNTGARKSTPSTPPKKKETFIPLGNREPKP